MNCSYQDWHSTRVADSVPTTYGDGAIVKNSILGDGCEINGIVEIVSC